jgi:hypothetical protein
VNLEPQANSPARWNAHRALAACCDSGMCVTRLPLAKRRPRNSPHAAGVSATQRGRAKRLVGYTKWSVQSKAHFHKGGTCLRVDYTSCRSKARKSALPLGIRAGARLLKKANTASHSTKAPGNRKSIQRHRVRKRKLPSRGGSCTPAGHPGRKVSVARSNSRPYGVWLCERQDAAETGAWEPPRLITTPRRRWP